MTRHTEPVFTSYARRRARAGDGDAPLGQRLDAQAREQGYGTWSALLASNPPTTPHDCAEPPKWWDAEPKLSGEAFTGSEGLAMARCVAQLACDVRRLDLASLCDHKPRFEALGGAVELTAHNTTSVRWRARHPFKEGPYDHDDFERLWPMGMEVARALDDGTRGFDDLQRHLSGHRPMRDAFVGTTAFVDVRAGRLHRVGMRLRRPGGAIWEARLDVGFRVTIMAPEDMAAPNGNDPSIMLALIDSKTRADAVDPRALGLVPYAAERRRGQGMHPEGMGFAYDNQFRDMGMARGVSCRLESGQVPPATRRP